MEALPVGYKKVESGVKAVADWFSKKKAAHEAAISGYTSKIQVTGVWRFWPVGFMGAIVFGGALLAPGVFSRSVFGGLLCCFCGAGGLWFGVRGIYLDSHETDRLVAQEEKEWREDPLRERAELILAAVRAFNVHCRRYTALCDRVRDHIQEEDADVSSRYLAFLARAHTGIERARDNFCRVVEVMQYTAQQKRAYPEIEAADEETTRPLARLMAQLNEPVEMPPGFGVPFDPLAALEREELLTGIIAGDSKRELDAQIALALGEGEGNESVKS